MKLYINIHKKIRKNNWGRNVLGAEMTRGRDDKGPNCRWGRDDWGRGDWGQSDWGRDGLGPKCLGAEMVWGRSVCKSSIILYKHYDPSLTLR